MAAEVAPGGDKDPVEAVAHEPTPDEVAALLDEMEFLLQGCNAAEQEIVRLRFEGYSSSEAAERVGCSR